MRIESSFVTLAYQSLSHLELEEEDLISFNTKLDIARPSSISRYELILTSAIVSWLNLIRYFDFGPIAKKNIKRNNRQNRIEKSKKASSDTGTKKLLIENENLEDFKLNLSDSTCDEISDIVEKDTSDSEKTIPKIRKIVTSLPKAKPKVKSTPSNLRIKKSERYS